MASELQAPTIASDLQVPTIVGPVSLHRRICKPRRRPRRGCCCFHPDDPPDTPDPAIYSQQEQLNLGPEPTWNSPDITTNLTSPSWHLLSATQVVVRNLSPTASAVGVAVHLGLSGFGIGLQRTPFSTQVINLDVGQETQLFYPLSQQILDGDPHIGAHVRIEHAVDQNIINNVGSQMIAGATTSQDGRNLTFTFPVRNPEPVAQVINLSVLANDLGASVSPVAPSLAPFAQITATLTMSVPNSLHGTPQNVIRREITVIGRDAGNRLIDGLTYIIGIND